MRNSILFCSTFFLFFLFSCESFHDEVFEIDPESVFLSDGTEDGDFDQALYNLTLLFEDDLRDPLVTDLLVKKFENLYEMKLSNIISNPELKSISSIDEIQALESSLLSDGDQYYGAVMIPNYDIANFALEPIIAPGVEVEYNGDDLTGDVALGWYYNDADQKEYIYLDENLATTIERPVYIITNDDEFEAEKDNTVIPTVVKSAKSTLGTPYPKIIEAKVYTAYGESKADYNLRELILYTSGSSQVGTRRNLGNYTPNVIYSENQGLLGFGLTNVLRGYGITYERDWLKSYKTVSWVDGRYCSSCCKMKNSGDYYNKFWVDYDNGVMEELYPSWNDENEMVIHSNGWFKVSWVN